MLKYLSRENKSIRKLQWKSVSIISNMGSPSWYQALFWVTSNKHRHPPEEDIEGGSPCVSKNLVFVISRNELLVDSPRATAGCGEVDRRGCRCSRRKVNIPSWKRNCWAICCCVIYPYWLPTCAIFLINICSRHFFASLADFCFVCFSDGRAGVKAPWS